MNAVAYTDVWALMMFHKPQCCHQVEDSQQYNNSKSITTKVPLLNLPVILVCVDALDLLQGYSLSLVSPPQTALQYV